MADRTTRWVGPAEDPRRYRLADARPAGSGGQGVVYRAVRPADGRVVALKQLTALPLARWPLVRYRARLAGAVADPGLSPRLDDFLGPHPFAGPAPDAAEFDVPYLVTAWVEGEDLTTAVDGAALAEVLAWVRQVGRAADALHRRPTPSGLGIVHRDIKPSNVRVGGGGAVLVDLGVARPAGGPTMSSALGSPGWLPPEACDAPDRVGPAADAWQVAGLASWAVLGTPPGRRDPARHRAALRRALARRGAPRPRRLAAHIDAGLAGPVEDRPADLPAWCEDLVGLARPARHRPAAVLALLAVLVGLARSSAPAPAAAAPPALPAVEVVGVDPGPEAALDTGRVVRVRIRVPPGEAGGGATVRLAPRADGPVPPVEAAAAAEVTLAFTADRPVRVDALELTLRSPGGRVRAERVEPVVLVFGPPLPAGARCTAYDPAAVRIEGPGPRGWALVAGGPLAALADGADARRAAALAAGADRYCVVGPDPPDGLGLSTTHYWMLGDRLVVPAGPPRPDEDCHRYDPAALTAAAGPGGVRLGAGDPAVPLLVLRDGRDAALAAAVAGRYRWQCFVGRNNDRGDPAYRLDYWRG